MSRKSSSSGLGPLVLIGGVVLVLGIVGAAFLLRDKLPATLATAPAPTTAALITATHPTAIATVAAVTAAPATAIATTTAANVPALPNVNVTQGPWYTVFFTKPLYPEKQSDRSGGVDQAIVADMDNAQHTIEVAVFDFGLPSLTDAMVRAAKRGVQVRAVVDYEANHGSEDFDAALKQLKDAGIPVTENHRAALMHDKFAVIDNYILWTGSMNFTPSDVYRNNNNMLRLNSAALIQNYTQIFERLFLNRSSSAPSKKIPNPRVALDNGVTIENYFSPTGGAQKAILDRLRAAQSSIRITAFTFTDTEMAKVLKDKHKANVQVQGVFEKRNNDGLGAEYADLNKAGLDILEDGNCYILHSKVMIIDDKTVIMGSYNFTDAANKTNDENLLIIDDPTLAQLYTQEFERIYEQAKYPTKCG